MIAENRRVRAHVDKTLIVLVFAMALFGVLAVTIASFTPSSTSDTSLLNHIVESSYAVRQCVFLLIAPVIMAIGMNVPYHWLRQRAGLLYAGTTLLVLLVWVFNRAAGVKAWMDIIWGYTIQPSEFAKLSMILMLAKELSSKEHPMSTWREFVRIMMIAIVPCLIILASGEMGSMLVIVFFFAVMLYFSNVDIKILAALATVAIIGILLIYVFAINFASDSYRLQRILAFFDPEAFSSTDAYQQQQSRMAIGSGGMWGIGMFVNGAISQLNYVPADWTDFIYSTIGEAFGFAGCIGVLAVYLFMILRMLYLARYTRDKFGMLVIIGVMGMLLFHVFENVAMTIGKMPVTGIPLPFLSYGGSNMVTNVAGVTLVLNVTKNRSLTASILTPQTSTNPYRFTGRRVV